MKKKIINKKEAMINIRKIISMIINSKYHFIDLVLFIMVVELLFFKILLILLHIFYNKIFTIFNSNLILNFTLNFMHIFFYLYDF